LRRTCWILALVLILGIAACAPRRQEPVRLGLSLWPSYEHFRLAALTDSGGGMDAFRLVSFASPRDVRRAYELGQVDALCCTVGEFLHIRDSGLRDPVAVYVIDTSQGGDILLGPAHVDSLQELRGMRVGVERGTVGELLLAGALREAGLEPAEIVRVPIHLQLASDPLGEHSLDAVVCFPPFSTAWSRHPGRRILFDSSRLPHPLFDLLVVERSVLESRRADLVQLVRGHQRINDLRLRRGEWADSAMAAWERVDVEDFRATYAGLALHTVEEQARLLAEVLPIALEHHGELLMEHGLLERAAWQGAWDASVVRQAWPEVTHGR
jgi:NitT/TauT family transport system substrate-binding protein